MLRSLSDSSLVLLDVLFGAYGACADCHVVAFRENPRVEVWGDVVSDVHLGEVFVVFHFVVRQFDSLLERDGAGVVSGFDGFRHAAVGSVGADDDVDGESVSGVVDRVVDDVGSGGGSGEVDGGDEGVDKVGAS